MTPPSPSSVSASQPVNWGKCPNCEAADLVAVSPTIGECPKCGWLRRVRNFPRPVSSLAESAPPLQSDAYFRCERGCGVFTRKDAEAHNEETYHRLGQCLPPDRSGSESGRTPDAAASAGSPEELEVDWLAATLRFEADRLEATLKAQGPAPTWDFPASEIAMRAKMVVRWRALASALPSLIEKGRRYDLLAKSINEDVGECTSECSHLGHTVDCENGNAATIIENLQASLIEARREHDELRKRVTYAEEHWHLVQVQLAESAAQLTQALSRISELETELASVRAVADKGIEEMAEVGESNAKILLDQTQSWADSCRHARSLLDVIRTTLQAIPGESAVEAAERWRSSRDQALKAIEELPRWGTSYWNDVLRFAEEEEGILVERSAVLAILTAEKPE